MALLAQVELGKQNDNVDTSTTRKGNDNVETRRKHRNSKFMWL